MARAWIGRVRRRVSSILERRGYHLTRVGYDKPIPNRAELAEDLWRCPSELVGVDLREADQLKLVSGLAASYATEYARVPREPAPGEVAFYSGNGWFDSIDAELLYCMIRHFKPRRVIEIGSGYSTLVAAEAARANEALDSHTTEISAIEPHPRDFLVELAGDRWRLTRSPVEEVELAVFAELEANDILFIDSSHVVRIGGDVVYEFLEILPRLDPGVIVHVHDIFFPVEYPREWVMELGRFWTEQYLLRAFLMFNTDFEVLASSNLLHTDHAELLTRLFSSYPPLGGYRPASFWMRRGSSTMRVGSVRSG